MPSTMLAKSPIGLFMPPLRHFRTLLDTHKESVIEF
jgi:hypothetical protein